MTARPNVFLPNDRMFQILSMTTDHSTSSESAIPVVAGLCPDELDKTIMLNRQRCAFMGGDPAVLTSQAARYEGATWELLLLPDKRSNGTVRHKGLMQFRSSVPLRGICMIFIDDTLLYVFSPTSTVIATIKMNRLLASGSRITIIADQSIVQNATSGDFWITPEDTSSPSEGMVALSPGFIDLREQARDGKFLTKKGGLSKAIFQSSEVKETLAEMYTQLDSILERDFGYRALATHGTLLGFVREGDLIANDDDFDCAYVSRLKTCAEVSKERFAIIERLTAESITCNLGTTGHLKVRKGRAEIDLMPAWFEDGTYNVSGFTSIPLLPEDIFPLTEMDFFGARVQLPARPEIFLERNYGESWCVPDPFYRTKTNRAARANRAVFVRDQNERMKLT